MQTDKLNLISVSDINEAFVLGGLYLAGHQGTKERLIMKRIILASNKKLSKNQVPTEVLYLKKVYKVTIPKKSYPKFMIICSLINTFIISTIYMIIMYLLNHIILRIIIGVILLILMIIICYGFLAKYYLWKEGR